MNDIDTFVGPIINAGAFGVLSWVIFHVFTKAMPALQSQMVDELRTKREEFLRTLNLTEERFVSALNSIREEHRHDRDLDRAEREKDREQLARLTDAIDHLLDRENEREKSRA